MMKYFLLASLLMLPLLSACNTFEGMGQDMQKGGESLEKTADRNK